MTTDSQDRQLLSSGPDSIIPPEAWDSDWYEVETPHECYGLHDNLEDAKERARDLAMGRRDRLLGVENAALRRECLDRIHVRITYNRQMSLGDNGSLRYSRTVLKIRGQEDGSLIETTDSSGARY